MKTTKLGICLLALCWFTVALAQNDDKKFEKEVFAGVSMNNFTGDDIKGSDMKTGFNVGFTARYYFVKNLFLEGSLGVASKGYKSHSEVSSGQYWDDYGPNYDGELSTNYTSYNLDLPVLLGYRISASESFNIKLKVGPYFTYALSGKKKDEGYMITYPDIHSSEKEYINKETKIGDMKNFKSFGCGIHAGVSVNIKKVVLTASYQRGLSKVFDKDKSYEQNVLISLGYKF